MNRTALIMAGGTGGHVFPALAVADCLAGKGVGIVWLGTRAGMEAKLVPAKGFAIEWISFAGLRGKGALRFALLPFFLVLACGQSLVVLLRRRPDVVLGMGGYVSFPGGLMAVLFNRPLVVHEQNAIAGLTNRVLAGVADRVLAGFPNAFDENAANRALALLPRPKSVQWCGNPVRAEIVALSAPDVRMAGRRGALRLLVVGGSQGARALNEALPRALALIPIELRPSVAHQAGAAHHEGLRAAYEEAGVTAVTLPFIKDIAARYEWCDLVVCRAGALTVAEIAAAGVASILVPFPFAVDDHQSANARFLADQEAALLVPQSELSPERLALLLRELTREKCLAIALKARALARPHATEEVASACIELAARGS